MSVTFNEGLEKQWGWGTNRCKWEGENIFAKAYVVGSGTLEW